MHRTFCSRPHCQHSGLAYDKGPSGCRITAVKQHMGPRVLKLVGHRPRMLPAALRMGAPCSPCPLTQCDAPTGWPSSTPGSDPLGATKAVFPLHTGHGPGSWSPHSHQNQMPSHPSSLLPVPQLLAPPTLNIANVEPPSPLWSSGQGLSGPSPGQCKFTLGYHPSVRTTD